MKYRYVLSRDDAKNKLTISEFTRGVDENLTNMGSREVDGEAIEAALAQGGMAVVDVVRSHGMYPPENVAMDMARLVADLFGSMREEIKEGYIDEVDVITAEVIKPEVVDAADDDDDIVDDDLPDEDILESDDLELGDTDDIVEDEEDDVLD
ncbi:MAG: hypothetical protein JEZ02_03715 [Desulfatibacillum sp.]|nr:hypothetical protein [Desulfatibacillum sp.]